MKKKKKVLLKFFKIQRAFWKHVNLIFSHCYYYYYLIRKKRTNNWLLVGWLVKSINILVAVWQVAISIIFGTLWRGTCLFHLFLNDTFVLCSRVVFFKGGRKALKLLLANEWRIWLNPFKSILLILKKLYKGETNKQIYNYICVYYLLFPF